jgi:hypothetical protein
MSCLGVKIALPGGLLDDGRGAPVGEGAAVAAAAGAGTAAGRLPPMGITVAGATAGTAAGRLPPVGAIVAAAGTSAAAGWLPPVGVIAAAKPTTHSLCLKQVNKCAGPQTGNGPLNSPLPSLEEVSLGMPIIPSDGAVQVHMSARQDCRQTGRRIASSFETCVCSRSFGNRSAAKWAKRCVRK